MAVLVLLNGGPASGKSTLAHLWAQQHPMALCLDVDILRSMIANWPSHPIEAGNRARRLALAMIADHLASGYDVIVPQYLAQPAFIRQLAETAAASDAGFVELVLVVAPEVAEARFADRAERAAGSHAGPTIHGELGAESMRAVYDGHRDFIATRGSAIHVEPVDGDLAASLRRLDTAIDGAHR